MSVDKSRFIRCVGPVKPGRFRDAWAVRQARAEAQKVYLQMKMRARRNVLDLDAMPVKEAASGELSAERVASIRRDVLGLKE